MANITEFINNLTGASKIPVPGVKKPVTTSNMSLAVKSTPTGNQSATTPVVAKKPALNYTPYQGSFTQKNTTPTPTVTPPPPPIVTPPPIEKPILPPNADTYINNLSSQNSKVNSQSDIGTPTPIVVENPYKKYLDSFSKDYQRLSDIQTRNEKQGLDALAEQEKIRTTSGGLLSGTNLQLGAANRKASLESAYGAIEEGAAARTAGVSQKILENAKEENKPVEVGGVLYQKQTDGSYKAITSKSSEGFTLGKDQVRYDAQGNIIAGGTSSSTGGIYTPGANPTADAWVKYVQNGGKISDVPNEYQNAVALGTTSQAKPQSEINKQTISTIDQLLTNPSFDKIFGPVDQLLGGLLGPQAILAKNQYNQLKGLLSLENIKYLKGTGAISDAEQKLLSNAASQLSRGLYGEQAREVLTKLKQDLNVVQDNKLAPDEEAFLRSKGYTDEEIKSLKGFNSVGKTTASNIPQRNLNPGNVKSGGLADSLAVGKDKQGHLIFPDEETGFKALTMDLEAKINGRSKFLPANPTIAQLGKVYAEDKKWAESVAKILGISTLTPTKNIPIDKLTKAIALQEGYFA